MMLQFQKVLWTDGAPWVVLVVRNRYHPVTGKACGVEVLPMCKLEVEHE
jgi:hypothetical protein